VDAEIAECDNEAKALAAGRRDFAIAKKRDHAAEVGLLRQIDYATAQLGSAEALRTVLMAQTDARHKWAATASSAAARTAALQAGIDDGQKALREAHSRKAALEVQASAVRATIAAIDGKLPQLNEEKKAAVTERKFKEASRLTAEVKRLSDQREEAERELSTLLSGIDACDHDITAQQAAVAESRARLAEHEAAVDAARVDTLRTALRDIRRHLRHLCRPPRRFTAAGLRRALAKEGLLAPYGSLTLRDTAALSKRLGELAYAAQLEDPTVPDYESPPPPADGALGIAFVGDKALTPVQVACREILEAEREVLLDEFSQLCVKRGNDVDLGRETESEPEPDAEAYVLSQRRTAASTPAPAAAPSTPAHAVASASHGDGTSADTAGQGGSVAAVVTDTDSGTDAGAVTHHDTAQASPPVGGEVAADHAADRGAVGADDDAIDAAALASLAAETGMTVEEMVAAMAAEADHQQAGYLVGDGPATPTHAAGGAGAGADATLAPVDELPALQQQMQSLLAAVREKEDQISAAVAREDFDAAGACPGPRVRTSPISIHPLPPCNRPQTPPKWIWTPSMTTCRPCWRGRPRWGSHICFPPQIQRTPRPPVGLLPMQAPQRVLQPLFRWCRTSWASVAKAWTRRRRLRPHSPSWPLWPPPLTPFHP